MPQALFTGIHPSHILGPLVAALLALLCLPVGAGVPPPSGTIPALDAKVTALRFFEGAYEAPPREQRAYVQRFDPARTRYVHWELTLEHPPQGRRRVFSIQSVWSHPDGRVLARLSMHTAVEAEWTWSYHHASWQPPAGWAAGTYRVELYVRGLPVAGGAFEVGEAASAAERVSRGMHYATQQRWDEALAEFSAALAQDPKKVDAYSNRAFVYYQKGQNDRAIADGTAALALNPRSGAAYVNRGLAYAATDRMDQAIADYTKAIEVDPRVRGQAFFNRGVLYGKQGRVDEALADYAQAIADDDEASQAYHNRGALYADVKRQYDRALAEFTKAITIDPNYALAYESRAIAYYHIGDYAGAWADVERVQTLGRQVSPPLLEALRQASGAR
jgi:tetratricopeptide (TPR) repeat protein